MHQVSFFAGRSGGVSCVCDLLCSSPPVFSLCHRNAVREGESFPLSHSLSSGVVQEATGFVFNNSLYSPASHRSGGESTIGRASSSLSLSRFSSSPFDVISRGWRRRGREGRVMGIICLFSPPPSKTFPSLLLLM